MKVIIIGGGASGMMAAITAIKNGNEAVLLERQARLGKKLLSTGNGRCNLTNINTSPEHYFGGRRDYITRVISSFDQNDTTDFFHSLGLLTVAETSGRVYPFSDSAGSVLDVLRLYLDALGADVRCGFDVIAAKKIKNGFTVSSQSETVTGDRLIICCGGMAGSKLGGTDSGYRLLKAFGHGITPLHPSLVQLKTDNTFVKALKGVRAQAGVTVCRNSGAIARTSGEVQFTEYGISGPAIFEVSRAVSISKGELSIVLDLLQALSEKDICKALYDRIKEFPGLTCENLLTGMLHNRLGRTVVRYAGLDLNKEISELTDKEINTIAHSIKYFSVRIIGTLSFESAQVTAGGAELSEFKQESLESRLVPGLYAAGEVLDVDGECGGFNLQWAWSSGHLAGQLL